MTRKRRISAILLAGAFVLTAPQIVADTLARYEVETPDTDPTVTDRATGLVWQQTPSVSSTLQWHEALAHCEGLDYAGQTDWRLPNVLELATIVDEKKVPAPAINTHFFETLPTHAGYWTSTTARTIDSSAYGIYFNDQDNTFGRGGVTMVSKTSLMLVLCVRTGTP